MNYKNTKNKSQSKDTKIKRPPPNADTGGKGSKKSQTEPDSKPEEQIKI